MVTKNIIVSFPRSGTGLMRRLLATAHKWDIDFIQNNSTENDIDELIKMAEIANYLIIPDLKNLMVAAIASALSGKSTEEMRALLHEQEETDWSSYPLPSSPSDSDSDSDDEYIEF